MKAIEEFLRRTMGLNVAGDWRAADLGERSRMRA